MSHTRNEVAKEARVREFESGGHAISKLILNSSLSFLQVSSNLSAQLTLTRNGEQNQAMTKLVFVSDYLELFSLVPRLGFELALGSVFEGPDSWKLFGKSPSIRKPEF